MALGKRATERQDDLWIVAAQLPRGPGHPFYRRLNQLLAAHGFDAFVEGLCRKFYHDSLGRPGIPPGVYFRMLLVGYFEGLDSERGPPAGGALRRQPRAEPLPRLRPDRRDAGPFEPLGDPQPHRPGDAR